MKPFRLTLAGCAVAIGALSLAGCGTDDRSAAQTPLTSEERTTAAAPAEPQWLLAAIDGDYKAPAGTVIARINGAPLTELDLEVLEERMSEPMRRAQLLEQVKEIRLLAQRARAEGLDENPRVQARLRHVVDNQLANDYLTDYLESLDITDAQVQAVYDEFVASLPDEVEFRASHILVAEEEQAQELIVALDEGADFAELASTHSMDPGSGAQGGDLGWFMTEQMVPEFSAGVMALEPGNYSPQPVQSDFGWHIIYLDDQREVAPPTLDMLRSQLENEIRRKAIETLIDDLRAEANIEILTDVEGVRPGQ